MIEEKIEIWNFIFIKFYIRYLHILQAVIQIDELFKKVFRHWNNTINDLLIKNRFLIRFDIS